jgi:hypothetical protein
MLRIYDRVFYLTSGLVDHRIIDTRSYENRDN